MYDNAWRFGNGPPSGKALFVDDRYITAQFLVVRDPPVNEIELIENQQLGKRIQAYIVPGGFSAEGTVLRGEMQGNDECPANFAFDAFARIGDCEIEIGSFGCIEHSTGYWPLSAKFSIDKPLPTKMDIILRSSAKAARAHADLDEIWNGELIYHDVPVMINSTTKP